MTFHASWNTLFNSLATANKSGNWKVASSTGAMDFEASLNAKMTSLNQPYGLLLVADNKKEVIILHNPHNFGGTLLRPRIALSGRDPQPSPSLWITKERSA